MARDDDVEVKPDPAPIEMEFIGARVRIRDAGDQGLIVAVDDGRGEDWPAAHLEATEADRLRSFLVSPIPEPKAEPKRGPFSARLNVALSHRGVAHRLAIHLGHQDMCISHWRRGKALPGPEAAVRIARFFHWEVKKTLRLLAEEVAARAVEHRDRKPPSGNLTG